MPGSLTRCGAENVPGIHGKRNPQFYVSGKTFRLHLLARSLSEAVIDYTYCPNQIIFIWHQLLKRRQVIQGKDPFSLPRVTCYQPAE